MSNLNQDPQEWLRELFEDQYCAECGGDAQHHDAIPFLGNWFARCRYPIADDSEDFHSIIQTYREAQS